VFRRIGWSVAAAVLLTTCAPPAAEGPTPSPQAGAEPEIRIGLVMGASRIQIRGDVSLTIIGGSGDPLAGAPSSDTWTVVPDAGSVALVAPDGWRSAPQAEVVFAPTSPGVSVSVNDRPYRGRIVVRRDRTGLTAVNRLGLEPYLAGVVSAEMGRRDSTEDAALAAQAVVSRTFAIRNLGKRESEGFDLYATVIDQVYGGVSSETPQSWRAVRSTAGRVVSFQGGLIDAFFFSTCGGRTATGTEVYANADRPYLRSIRDEDENGQAYCRISPRYRWREEWSGDALVATLVRTLPAVVGTPASDVRDVRSVRVVSRSGSDRVLRLAIELGPSAVMVDGPAIRQVLRPSTDQLLRSNAFVLTETRTAGRLTHLVAEGSGAGHAVGFCQWGAVGRARAGQAYDQILSAYFPETEVERLY
jgi:stage II sporulation protein D